MTPQDRTIRETIAALCGAAPFIGATVPEVLAVPGRHLCLRLRLADGRRVFVKRTRAEREPSTADPVAREAVVLTALSTSRTPAPRPLLTVDVAGGTVLVVEDVAGQGTLDRCRELSGGTDAGWAAAVGRALAEVHATPACFLPGTNPVHALVREWTVVTPHAVTRSAAGYAEMLRLLRCSRLEEPLKAAAAEWAPETAVHGDVRTPHILCRSELDGTDSVRLVDWSTGGRGDPRWDVGALIADYLFSWLSGIDLDAGTDLDDRSAGDPPFAAVQDELCAATAAYSALRTVRADDRRQWLRYAAVSLVERLVAPARHDAVLPARTLAVLQVAAQLLRRPAECEELLLCP